MRNVFPIVLCLAIAAGWASPSVAAVSDAKFLTKAMQGDNSEMKLGQMAEQKGSSAETRDFGRMLNTDHAKARFC